MLPSIPLRREGPVMPTQTLNATVLDSKAATGTRPASSPLVLALSSALLLWFSFPPVGWGWLAWVALVPLFLLVVSSRSPWTIYPAAWVGGMVFWVLSIQWVRLCVPSALLAWLGVAAALSFSVPRF